MELPVTASPKTPLPVFFLLAYLFAWGLWLVPLLGSHGIWPVPSGVQLVCLLVGSYAPFMAAFVVLLRDGGWPGLGRFALRALRWRVAPGYLLAALLLVPALGLAAAWIYARFGGPALALTVPVGKIPLLFVMMLFVGGAVNEEFGWAYAIDGLQRGCRLRPAAIVLGVIWACWHLPLFFIVGVTQSFLPFWAFLLFAVSLRVLFVWAYEGGGKSILATLLFHTTVNLTLNLFVLVDRSPARNERGFIAFALLALAVATVVALVSKRYRSAAVLPIAYADEA